MVKELLFETNLNSYLNYFKLEKKSFNSFRWILALFLFFMPILAGLFLPGHYSHYKVLLIVLAPVVGFLGFKMSYIDLLLKKKNDQLLIEYAFPQFLRYFISLIQVKGNVYQALIATVPYIEEPLKSQVELLTKRIASGNKREAYMDFADFINTSEASMIMSIIYDFSEDGIKSESLQALEQYIFNMYNNKMNELIDKKVNKMENYSKYPLIFSVLFVLSFVAVLFYHYFFETLGKLNF